ncbi:3-hydroxyacyl-CoA dehydrogenase NAD-binding domain-containing protein [Hydrogenophaga sp. BPS33]|uniref:3-hydroxyacyl-CoA dehydrogenase NAD-binding domain-containing protein n=1 Tax=Hydrogenophaga sp. BPS33 TaxID=2651974 RepID=UPI00131FD3DE|nr:3-hydroxyacyl-CoA dehydrogenase NAD-binding domain-containing protein [Hydrogenophaga sp. BPS33]QHE87424.1 3-hydroxyacyl-CoA dehydrogenase [Hydrogenophaga sp. BPS33]
MTVHLDTRSSIAVLTLKNPPVNSLGLQARRDLARAFDQALADPAIAAIVLTGEGKGFSGGADIREFGTPDDLAEPNLLTLIRTLENASKPVIAAIHGVCLGGGLELALGCHYRVATAGARMGLPEVKIGLLPGGGGTQRLPRAIGLEAALNMVVSGQPVVSETLAALPGQGLIDLLTEGDLLDKAVGFAQKVAAQRPLPRLRDLKVTHANPDGYLAFARTAVKAAAKGQPAPLACVDAVAAALTPRFDDGLAREHALFNGLMATPEGKALRHAFFAERAAARIPDVPADTPTRRIETVAVIGAGTMGGGIAMNFLNAGMPVTLLETKQDALDRGLATIRKNYEAQVAKRKLSQSALEQRMALLGSTLSYDDIGDADLVIEAVFEDTGVKQQVFGRLDQVMKQGAILASNTSTLNLDQIASFTQRPQDVVGMHFFSPANVMKLLEVVRGAKTSADVLATVMALAKKIRKTAVVSGVCDGFIGNRMVEQYFRQAGFLLEEGCTPEQVDKAVERFGFAMGPFRMSDLAGNDIGWAIRKRRYVEQPDMRYSKTADLLCEQGRFGQKTGAGWYDYASGKRDAIPSADVNAMIDAHRQVLGIEKRRVGDEEIVQRLVYALVNEGAKIVDEGIASRASDVDMVYLSGYGFPALRGGPMHYAASQGLFNVVQTMSRFARNPNDDGAFWQPAPLLARLAAEGRSFS